MQHCYFCHLWSTIVPRLCNADGSLTIHLQAGSPGKDKEANWLPASRAPFLLILGTYSPGEAPIEHCRTRAPKFLRRQWR
jgi:hypothetical protein